MNVRLNDRFLAPFVAQHELACMAPHVATAHRLLHEGQGAGREFLGWLTLPRDFDTTELARIQSAAARIRNHSDVLLVIGIGGSYLGARAAIEFLHSQNYNLLKKPQIFFLGNNLSGAQLTEILELCEGREVSVNVISKSGTTTEPALAFRAVRDYLKTCYTADQLRGRIFITTDKSRGTLKSFADAMGYETFVVPDDVGGRYSVLTAVGLLPIAVSGADLDRLMAGAKQAMSDLETQDLTQNDCYRYAALRSCLHHKGKAIEILAAYEPRLTMFGEWYKQLFGESEGKDGKGIFPAAVSFSTDLHSVGQFIQEGSRNLFETVLHIGSAGHDVSVPHDDADMDGLNFLSGASMAWVNTQAMMGTVLAHTGGGVPNILLELDDTSETTLGYLFYFFMKACAISGYLLGVNPFDQPGVEAYKKNMFALLGKPGYEELGAQLKEQLK